MRRTGRHATRGHDWQRTPLGGQLAIERVCSRGWGAHCIGRTQSRAVAKCPDDEHGIAIVGRRPPTKSSICRYLVGLCATGADVAATIAFRSMRATHLCTSCVLASSAALYRNHIFPQSRCGRHLGLCGCRLQAIRMSKSMTMSITWHENEGLWLRNCAA